MTGNNRGFTIFFAMLVASLSLAIGLAIYDLTAREIDLSSTATQSQYAIYAADTGAECALYWDAKAPVLNGSPSAFATSTASSWATSGILCNVNGSGTSLDVTTLPPPTQDLGRYPECTGNSGSTWCTSAIASAATTTFSLSFPSILQSYCAVVQVSKQTIAGVLFTTITSRGYNTCSSASVTRVERTLQVSY